MIWDLVFESGSVTDGRKKTGNARWVPSVSERGVGPGCQPKKEIGGGQRATGLPGPQVGPSEGREEGALGRGEGEKPGGLVGPSAGPWPLATRPRARSLLPLFFLFLFQSLF